MRRGPRESGITLVELLAAIIVAGILLTYAIPVFNDAVGNNNTRMEANRMLVNIQLARSEAIKRGDNVYLCIADASDCDPGDLSTCKCKVGVPSKRYDQGWLVFTDNDNDGDFDDGTEELLFVGHAPADQIEMRSNNLVQHGFGLASSGAFADASSQGEIAICFNGESTEGILGRMLVLKVTGRTELRRLAPGDSCSPSPPGGGGPGGGGPGGGGPGGGGPGGGGPGGGGPGGGGPGGGGPGGGGPGGGGPGGGGPGGGGPGGPGGGGPGGPGGGGPGGPGGGGDDDDDD